MHIAGGLASVPASEHEGTSSVGKLWESGVSGLDAVDRSAPVSKCKLALIVTTAHAGALASRDAGVSAAALAFSLQ